MIDALLTRSYTKAESSGRLIDTLLTRSYTKAESSGRLIDALLTRSYTMAETSGRTGPGASAGAAPPLDRPLDLEPIRGRRDRTGAPGLPAASEPR